MTFEVLECFAAIAQGGTYLNVAEDFNLSQSALSKMIRKMEDELGTMLFDRTGRSVKLTHSGEQLLADYLDMEPYYVTMKIHMKEMSSKYRIRVFMGMPGSVLNIKNILEMFVLKNPQIPIEIVESQTNRISQGRHAIRLAEASMTIIHKTFECRKDSYKVLVQNDPLLCLLPPNHPLAQKDSISLEDLLKERILANSWTRDIISEICKDFKVTFLNVREVNQEKRGSVLWNVSEGMGVTLFYFSDVKDISVANIAMRPVDFRDQTPIILYMNDRAKELKNCAILRDYMAQALKKEWSEKKTPLIIK